MTYIEEFHKLHFEMVEQMRDCSHHYLGGVDDAGDLEVALNPWHMEGDVWSHTMMVNNLAGDDELVPEENSKVVGLATLLHDIGKVHARTPSDERRRVNFHGHAGISSYWALNFLNKLPVGEISVEEYVDIFYIISLHHSYMDLLGDEATDKQLKKFEKDFIGKRHLMEMVLQHMKCDSLGRFSMGEGGYCTEKWQVRSLEKKYKDQIRAAGDAELATTIPHKSPRIGIMIGPPGCGKTTYIKEAELDKEYDVILSRDEILMEHGGGIHYSEAWDKVDHKEVDVEFELRFANAISERASILIDKTSISRKARNRILSRTPREYFKVGYLMMTSFDDIFERNTKRTNKHLDPAIIFKMMGSFLVPSNDEFDYIRYVID